MQWVNGITPKGEEVLSYFIGLAPVGDEFILNRKHMKEDLGFGHRSAMSHMIRNLIWLGYIRRTARSQFMVLRRS